MEYYINPHETKSDTRNVSENKRFDVSITVILMMFIMSSIGLFRIFDKNNLDDGFNFDNQIDISEGDFSDLVVEDLMKGLYPVKGR
jgi:hypothetical protein